MITSIEAKMGAAFVEKLSQRVRELITELHDAMGDEPPRWIADPKLLD